MSETIIFTDKFREAISLDLYGRSYSLAKAGNQCVQCGKLADKFRDKLSEREYQISACCQDCQDKFWGGLPNE
jgi:uncharacterized CHY-type Zn-finger protein